MEVKRKGPWINAMVGIPVMVLSQGTARNNRVKGSQNY